MYAFLDGQTREVSQYPSPEEIASKVKTTLARCLYSTIHIHDLMKKDTDGGLKQAILELARKNGPNKTYTEYNWTLLHMTCKFGKPFDDVTAELLGMGADPNQEAFLDNYRKFNPMFLAMWNNNPDTLRMLLNQGGDMFATVIDNAGKESTLFEMYKLNAIPKASILKEEGEDKVIPVLDDWWRRKLYPNLYK